MSEKKTRQTVSKARDRRILNYILIALAVLVVGGLLAFGGWRSYQLWKTKRAITNSRQFLERKDYGQAWVSAGRAVQLDRNNVEAIRLMAEAAEAEGRDNKVVEKRMQALALRKRVAELQPGVNENYLDVARAAMEVRDPRTAEEALSKLNEAGKKSAAYHEVAAKLALVSGQGSQIEGHVTEAARLDPENETYQLQLAAVRLGSPVPEIRKGAVATLEQLAENPKVRRQALRTLLQTSFFTGEMDRAMNFANQLKSGPEAQFEDQMLFLNLLGRLKRHEFWWYVAQLEAGPPADDQDLTNALSWLNNHGLPAVARDWAKRLPEERRYRLPVTLAYAESLVMLASAREKEDPAAAAADWDQLEQLLKLVKDWRDLDFQREALFARLLRARGDAKGDDALKTSSRDHWGKAVSAAGSRPFALQALVRFATAWKWNDEYIRLLWTIANGRENPQPALQILLRKYVAENKTRELVAVFTRMLELNPNDAAAKNNLAYALLLLNQDWDRAQILAAEANKSDPKNPGYAATYAYSIYLKGKKMSTEVDKALKVMDAVDPEALKVPSTALCYGLLLSAKGDTEAARKYLQLANAGQLLPEEKLLAGRELERLPQR
ncbi:MAG TPA: hypothetical protein VFD27_16405 [Chthoniobacteraceae bacterium]|nr:hypothetical protein [Chthoniobacteraceae bacterium]